MKASKNHSKCLLALKELKVNKLFGNTQYWLNANHSSTEFYRVLSYSYTAQVSILLDYFDDVAVISTSFFNAFIHSLNNLPSISQTIAQRFSQSVENSFSWCFISAK